MKRQILNRFTNEVIYECEVDNLGTSMKLKTVVLDAIACGVNLRYADLSGEDLSYARFKKQ